MTNAIVPNLTQLSPEQSSQIEAHGYNDALLYIKFRRGGLYVYDAVTPEEYAALAAAPSIGSVFARTIKGVKPYKRLDTKAAAAPKAEVVPIRASAPAPVAKASKAALAPATPDDGSLAAMVRDWAAKAKSMIVADVSSHAAAQAIMLKLAEIKKRVVTHHADTKKKTYEAWKSICAAEKSLLDPIEEADKLLRSRIGEFTYQQMRAAQEEDERRRKVAEEEARKRAIEETESNALAAAEELYAMGDVEAAEAVLSNPMPAEIRYQMPMPVRPAVAAVEGVSGSIGYEITIHDLNAVPREYLVIDIAKTQTEIARRAKQAGGRLQVSGVTIRETFVARRAGGRR